MFGALTTKKNDDVGKNDGYQISSSQKLRQIIKYDQHLRAQPKRD